MRQCDESASERDAEYRKMRVAYDRESAERVRAHMLASAHEDGYQEGLALGLLSLLIRRFGTLHEEALVHLACASINELRSARDLLCESTDLACFLERQHWPLAPTGSCGSVADADRLVEAILGRHAERSLAIERLIMLREEQYYAAAAFGRPPPGDDTDRTAAVEAANELRARDIAPGSLPSDPEVIALRTERDPTARLQLHRVAAARREGAGRGYEEGACILLRLAQKRFGELPEWAKKRIYTASSKQHSAWINQLLDAPSLEALLAADAEGSGEP